MVLNFILAVHTSKKHISSPPGFSRGHPPPSYEHHEILTTLLQATDRRQQTSPEAEAGPSRAAEGNRLDVDGTEANDSEIVMARVTHSASD